MENVIVFPFSGTDRARAALRGLQGLHDAGDIRLEAVAVMGRNEDGRAVTLEQPEDVQIKGTATGGVIGGIIGLFGGPFGLFVGGATGAMVGAMVDIADIESSDDVLRSLVRAVPPGYAATIAVVVEPTHAAVDALASSLGVAVLRRSRAELEFEIAEEEVAALARERHADTSPTIGDRSPDVKEAVVDRRRRRSFCPVAGPPPAESVPAESAVRLSPLLGARRRGGPVRRNPLL